MKSDFIATFEFEIVTRTLSVGIKYSKHDLIFDVINYCVWSYDMGI